MNDLRFFPDEPPYVGKSFFRPNGSIKFDPILTDQRYSFVVNLLDNNYWKHRVKTVADFGCADLQFFRVLRSLRFLRTVFLVRARMMENCVFAMPHQGDTQILARTIANTDTLVRRLRMVQQENVQLQCTIRTVEKTASKLNKTYLSEKEKCSRNEELLRQLRAELRDTQEREQAQNHQIVNMDRLHQQTVEEVREAAGKMEKSQEKFFIQVCRELLRSVRALTENDVLDGKAAVRVNTLRNKMEGFSCLKGVLKDFPAAVKSPRKRRKPPVEVPADESSSDTEAVDDVSLVAAQVEDNIGLCSVQEVPMMEMVELPKTQEVEVQTCQSVCDRGTMTTSITITRGTNTEFHVKTANVGTHCPEFEMPPSSFAEIFEEMIVDLPEIVEELPRVPMKDAATTPERHCVDAETVTDLCNVRKVIGYRKRRDASAVANVKVENLKIEPPSPLPSDEIPILHPHFERVWKIMGQTLFAVLRSSASDLTQSQYFHEVENLVKQILKEELLKGEFPMNNFLPDVLHPAVTLLETSPVHEMFVETHKAIEAPSAEEEEEIELPKPTESLVKRKKDAEVKKPLKKIKLQPQTIEEEKNVEEDDFEFNLEEIRDFYAHPDLLEMIGSPPEATPNAHHEELPRMPSSRPSIMNFVFERETFQRFPKASKGDIQRKCEAVLREYLQAEWVTSELERFVDKMWILRPSESVLFDAIAAIAEDTADQLVFNPFGSLAPLVPKTHQQIIIFCHTVAQHYPPGHLRRLQHSVERCIFTLTSEKRCLKKLINLTYLVIPLMDLQFEERHGRIPAHLFIFKCLYYFHHKAPALIYMLLRAFPDVLPAGEEEENFERMDPLLLALRCALAHLPPLSNAETERAEYKKRELLQLLLHKYKYTPGRPSPELTTKILMQHLRQGNCQGISYALTLLGKRCGTTWAETNLVRQHLIPRLNDILMESPGAVRNDQIVTLVTAISCIVKAFPNMKDPAEYHRIFSCVLDSTADQPHVQEAAVAAFLRLSRFGMISVFSQIYKWHSRAPISRQLAAALETFVHRKPKKYWTALEKQI